MITIQKVSDDPENQNYFESYLFDSCLKYSKVKGY